MNTTNPDRSEQLVMKNECFKMEIEKNSDHKKILEEGTSLSQYG